MASVRPEELKCQQNGCGTVVAKVLVTDSQWISNIRLDDSVTTAPGLREFVHVGYLRRAKVTHSESGGCVIHIIEEAA